eukprot:GFYU01009420.1.p1 GENE.GFYU01009420.1~~GFYU01009420.1.p1  ORF type:complete len:230 (-),score=34.85 GFYU01009420.1:54-743(-)
MGAAASSKPALSTNITAYIKKEYERVNVTQRDYIMLDEILNIEPLPDLPLDFCHLGTLYILDRAKNGRFRLSDLYNFAEFYARRKKIYKPHEFRTHIQAYCTLRMWEALKYFEQTSSAHVLRDWFCMLFYETVGLSRFEEYAGVEFVSDESIQTLHKVLSIRKTYGLEFQEFLDSLQQVAEESGHLKMEDERLDNLLPVETLKLFATNFFKGILNLMTQLGFDKIQEIE